MRTVRILSPAHRELAEAISYYESQRDGLGAEFAVEFDRAIAAVLENPMRWPQMSDNARRYRMHRFNFGIYYFVEPTEIVIAVVAHPSRDPASWHGRL